MFKRRQPRNSQRGAQEAFKGARTSTGRAPRSSVTRGPRSSVTATQPQGFRSSLTSPNRAPRTSSRSSVTGGGRMSRASGGPHLGRPSSGVFSDTDEDDMAMLEEHSNLVYARVRPLADVEIDCDMRRCVEIQSQLNQVEVWKPDTKAPLRFVADGVMQENESPEDSWRRFGPQLVDYVWDGHNASCLAHGPASSGKTRTVFGEQTPFWASGRGRKGLLDLAADDIFNRISASAHTGEGRSFLVEVQAGEMYGEQVMDLLETEACAVVGKRQWLDVHMHHSMGTYVRGLSRNVAKDRAEMQELLDLIRSTLKAKEATSSHSAAHCHVFVQFSVTQAVGADQSEEEQEAEAPASSAQAVAMLAMQELEASGELGDLNEDDENEGLEEEFDESSGDDSEADREDEEDGGDETGNKKKKGAKGGHGGKDGKESNQADEPEISSPPPTRPSARDSLAAPRGARASYANRMSVRSARPSVAAASRWSNLDSDLATRSVLTFADLGDSTYAHRKDFMADRLKEAGAAFSKSLAEMDSLVRTGVGDKIPQSSLCRLLKDSLTGDAFTVLLVHLRTTEDDVEEAIRTLKFMERFRRMPCNPNYNLFNKEAQLQTLQIEMKTYVRKLQEMGVSQAALTKVLSAANDATRDQFIQDAEVELDETRRVRLAQVDDLTKEELLAEWQGNYEARMELYTQLEDARWLIFEWQKPRGWIAEETLRRLRYQKAKLQELGLPENDDDVVIASTSVPALTRVLPSGRSIVYLMDEEENLLGRVDAEMPQHVILDAAGIRPSQATVLNVEGSLTLIVDRATSNIWHNGHRLTPSQTVTLRHCDRLLIGANNCFVVRIPDEQMRQRQADETHIEVELEKARTIYAYSRLAEEEKEMLIAKKRREIEAMLLLEEKVKLAYEKVDWHFVMREALNAQIETLLAAVAKLAVEGETLGYEVGVNKKMERKVVAMLADTLEANIMSEVLNKGIALELEVELVRGKLVWPLAITYDDDEPNCKWHYQKFNNRIHLMRELFLRFCENNYSRVELGYTIDTDPFFDPPQDQLIGSAVYYLEGVNFLLESEGSSPIINYKGERQGELTISVLPHPCTCDETSGDCPHKVEQDEDMPEQQLSEIVGRRMRLVIKIHGARNLPQKLCHGVHVDFRFFTDEDYQKTDRSFRSSTHPVFNSSSTFKPLVTEDFIDYVQGTPLEFEVWGASESKVSIAAVKRQNDAEPLAELVEQVDEMTALKEHVAELKRALTAERANSKMFKGMIEGVNSKMLRAQEELELVRGTESRMRQLLLENGIEADVEEVQRTVNSPERSVVAKNRWARVKGKGKAAAAFAPVKTITSSSGQVYAVPSDEQQQQEGAEGESAVCVVS